MEFAIEKIENDFKQEILLDIWNDSLPALDARRINWSYENNPFGKAHVWLIKDTGANNYFGVCAVFPRKFRLGQIEVNAGIMADLAIKKCYRSLGPVLKLLRTVISSHNFETLIGIPNLSADSVLQRAGFKKFGKMKRFVKVFRLNKTLKSEIRCNRRPFISRSIDLYFRSETNLWKIRNIKKRWNTFSGKTKFGNETDKVWLSGSRKLGLVGLRERKYMNWRFCEYPYLSYRLFTLCSKNNNCVLGYIIFFEKNNIFFIDDLFVSDFERYFQELMKSFLKFSLEQGADALSLKLHACTEIQNHLIGLGFRSFETEQSIVIHPLPHEAVISKNFLLTVGDFDMS